MDNINSDTNRWELGFAILNMFYITLVYRHQKGIFQIYAEALNLSNAFTSLASSIWTECNILIQSNSVLVS